MSIEANISKINQLIQRFEKEYARPPFSVRLLIASKTQSIDSIKKALAAGQKLFGENYLQEALPKIEALRNQDIEWHFIGNIQSNKTKKIAESFAWAHCVNHEKIAKRLNDQRPINAPPINICIEVNLSQEASKSGINPTEVSSLAKYCLTLPRIKLRGLMAIPAPEKDIEKQRRVFRKLKQLQEELTQHNIPMDTLSMGMSDDFEAAIAEGSTLIRIGTAIFGERLSPKRHNCK